MTINGWDISEACAKQVSVVFGFSAITAKSMWPAGSPSPILIKPQTGTKSLRVILSVRDEGRTRIRDNVSLILSKMVGILEIELDGFLNTFRGTLRSFASEETSRKRWHKITVDLEGYEHAAEKIFTGTASVAVKNVGTAETPVRIEVSSSVALGSMTITCTETGWGISLPGVASGSALVIDGETGLVTQNGALVEATFHRLPTVPPGVSHFASSNPGANLTVKISPRFM